ncbi:MAG: hypothetical protein K6C11_02305 [Bacilli bacterium]|nr:hypothetical protein [Bacilli bacterium]
MVNENNRLNIILGIICLVFVIVILYMISYIKNLESAHIYFNVNEIKNVKWESNVGSLYTDGKTFTFTINGSNIFDNEELHLDTNTGMIVENRLYLRSIGTNNIVVWFDEAEYRLDRQK